MLLKKTATFLAMGKECTRSCGFCDIDFTKAPKQLSEDEPHRLAEAVAELGLKHAVITMVARDDIVDGGAAHLAKIIEAIRKRTPQTTIEVLTSDFEGNERAYDTILEAAPEIFNHNLETVERLTPKVRHKATFERSLHLLSYIKKNQKKRIFVKSGVMVGLGETSEEMHQTLQRLCDVGCDIVTLGQYLRPSRGQLVVKEFIHPDQFEAYASFGKSLGIKHIYAGPFVRSSYNAGAVFEAMKTHE